LSPFFEGLLLKDRVQHRIQFFFDILKKHRLAESDTILQRFGEIGIIELGHLEVIPTLHLADPVIGLGLRVDNEWPATGIKDQDAVLCGQLVGWEVIVLPFTDLVLIRQDTIDGKVS
jgi:hypothetical protein